MTTVHKKSDAPSPSLGKLAGVAPKLAPTSKSFETKLVRAKWETNEHSGNDYYRGKSYLHVGPQSQLASMGANLSLIPKEGSFVLTQGEMYDYLREGLSMPQAAALHLEDPSPENWVRKGNANNALPGSLSYAQYGEKARRVEIKNAVDALRAHEVTPQVAQKMLLHGFTDAHLDGPLDMDQKVRLFDRFKYQASTNENVETNAAATMDALIDGRLPFDLFERNFKRTSLTSALDAVYPKKRPSASSRTQNALTESDREYLRNNPDEIVNIIAAMEGPEGQYTKFEDAYKSIQLFGLDASMEHSPRILTMERADGSVVGVEGARKAREFRDFCQDRFQNDSSVVVSADPYRGIKVFDRGGKYVDNKASHLEIIEMKEAGASNETILELIYTQQLSGDQAIAVVKGETVASIGKGWL
jgi:hypothetical protein